jgi:membrane associated rhomboid family serine protease
MMRITETVKHLLILNIIFFIGSMVVGDPAVKLLALHFPANPDFKVWQIVTHMFMHGSVMHIFFNMFALFSFGGLLEQMWGPKKFIFFYISCGLGAAALHIGVNYYYYHQAMQVLADNGYAKDTVLNLLSQGQYNPKWEEVLTPVQLQNFISGYVSPMLGASGAIYGLLVAFAFMFPNAELMLMFIPIPIKAKYFVPALLAYDMFSGLRGQSVFGGGSDGIAHFAHIGGAVLGFIMMWYWKKNQYNSNRWN